jgi:hypothetical protein
MGDWEPDQTAMVEERTAFLWIVPARVEGKWYWETGSEPAELEITQSFQKITGVLRMDGRDLALHAPLLEGSRIGFTVGESQETMRVYAGRITKGGIEGLSQSGDAQAEKWTASRRPAQ